MVLVLPAAGGSTCNAVLPWWKLFRRTRWQKKPREICKYATGTKVNSWNYTGFFFSDALVRQLLGWSPSGNFREDLWNDSCWWRCSKFYANVLFANVKHNGNMVGLKLLESMKLLKRAIGPYPRRWAGSNSSTGVNTSITSGIMFNFVFIFVTVIIPIVTACSCSFSYASTNPGRNLLPPRTVSERKTQTQADGQSSYSSSSASS